ncbi:MAG: sugar ABC transporter permease [Candidatus Marsarchaeota archaeon]|nr:sugar ABC transporter permease [Candidatus Marsarchaeota archaeon]
MAVDVGQSVQQRSPTPSSRTWFGVSQLRRREAVDGMLMASPWVIGFMVFIAGPMIFGAYVSLTRWDIISQPVFIGLENFITMFSGKDALFYQSLKVTALYTAISAPLHVVLSFVLASLLNSKGPFKNVFRSIYYLPSILPVVATAVLWSWVFNPDFGLLNYGLSMLGIRGPKWLADKNWALPAIIIMNLQYIGPSMIIMLAGLQRVPAELIEAAQLDGANRWQLTRHITIPMLSSVIFLVIITNINASFQTFTQAFLMTNGGPQYATYFYMLNLYQQGWGSFRMGYASALAWVLFVIVVGFLIIHFRLSRLWVYQDTE